MSAQTSIPAGARELVVRTTSSQGLPLHVEDPVALDRLAVLLAGAAYPVDDAAGGGGGVPRGRRPRRAVQDPVGTGAGPQSNVNSTHKKAAASVRAAAPAPDPQHAIAAPTA